VGASVAASVPLSSVVGPASVWHASPLVTGAVVNPGAMYETPCPWQPHARYGRPPEGVVHVPGAEHPFPML